MNIKLLFIPLLLFSSQLYAETIHLGILNTSGNEAENVLYAETASVLKDKLNRGMWRFRLTIFRG